MAYFNMEIRATRALWSNHRRPGRRSEPDYTIFYSLLRDPTMAGWTIAVSELDRRIDGQRVNLDESAPVPLHTSSHMYFGHSSSAIPGTVLIISWRMCLSALPVRKMLVNDGSLVVMRD